MNTDDAKKLIDLARRSGKTDDELADMMLKNLADKFLPFLERQAFARALERQAVALMTEVPPGKRN